MEKITVDLSKYKTRLLKRLEKQGCLCLADAVSMAMPQLLAKSAELLESIEDSDHEIDRHSDPAGIVLTKDNQ